MNYVDQGPGARVISRWVSLSEITSSEVLQLHAYLEKIKGNRRFAAKADIDPAEIKPLLPLLALMDIAYPPIRIHYRLFGTALVDLYGNLTGKELHQRSADQRLLDEAWKNYGLLIAEQRPIYGVTELEINADKIRTFEWAFFPLSADDQRITHAVYIEQRSAEEPRSNLS